MPVRYKDSINERFCALFLGYIIVVGVVCSVSLSANNNNSDATMAALLVFVILFSVLCGGCAIVNYFGTILVDSSNLPSIESAQQRA